jgi:uncharacterized protein YndB with AHSA1/START domain
MSDTSTGTMTLSLPSERSIRLERVFNAPRELVFAAWTQPEHVRQWWGQKGSTMTLCEIDLRPGGEWRYVELAADGNEYPFCGEYIEVSPPERLVHTFVFDVEPFNARPAVVTVTFEDIGGMTRMTETTVFQTVEDRDAMIESGMEGGARESCERLDALLRSLQS